MQAIRILVVDDNAGFRQRVAEFLAAEPDLKVVGEAADGGEALLKARELGPDIVLIDVRMPETDGISATRQIREQVPAVKVIVLSRFDVQEYREAAMASGASGYVLKRSLTENLLPTIKSVLKKNGQAQLEPTLKAHAADNE